MLVLYTVGYMQRRSRSQGFTIVELLIVIVVIGILAAIVIVAFNGVQQRARDSARKSDLAGLSKALQIYYINNGNYITTGGGSGNGTGWFNDGLNPGDPTILEVLQAQGLLIGNNIIDPKCGKGTFSSACPGYIKVNCTVGGVAKTAILTKLETLGTVAAPAVLSSCTSGVSWWNTYGFNYLIEVG